MNTIRISTAQFENRSCDKEYNLSVIDRIAGEAAREGSRAVAFHECSVTGYTFARKMSRNQLLDIAESIPDGNSVKRLIEISAKHQIAILAGLFEKDENSGIFKAYVCADQGRIIARFRKLHPFINPAILPGDSYCVFDLDDWKCGILICYDNNIIENVRATALLGADILFMPHVTMCTPSTRPGAGFVNPELWKNRETDPTSLRLEFDGMKGRSWLMKWLPSRAYDNGIYAVFSNAIGMDDDQLKNGCSMILDPFGDIIAECRMLGDGFVTATIVPQKLTQSGGYRYRQARKPGLYREILGRDHESHQKVIWLGENSDSQ